MDVKISQSDVGCLRVVCPRAAAAYAVRGRGGAGCAPVELLQSGAGAEGAGLSVRRRAAKAIYPTRKMYNVAAAVAASEPWLRADHAAARGAARPDAGDCDPRQRTKRAGDLSRRARRSAEHPLYRAARRSEAAAFELDRQDAAGDHEAARARRCAGQTAARCDDKRDHHQARAAGRGDRGMRGARLFDHPRRKRRRRHGGGDVGEVRRRHLRRSRWPARCTA